MKYQEIIDSCKIAIEKEWCLGCNRLELPNFVGKVDCEGATPPPPSKKAQECIKKCKEILGIQERIKL